MNGVSLPVILLVVACLAGCASPLAEENPGRVQASATTGIVRGAVVDEAIRPIAGVLVTLSSASSFAANLTTDDTGGFAFGAVPPGAYVVEANKTGFLGGRVAVQVQAGVDEPPAVLVMLSPSAAALAYAELYHWSGFLECSLDRVSLCGAFDLANRTTCANTGTCPGRIGSNDFDEMFPLDGTPDFLQAELAWEPTSATAANMLFFVQYASPESFDNGLYDGGFTTLHGASPLVAGVNRTALQEADVGRSTQFVAIVQAGQDDTVPAGVAFNQPFHVFVIAFFGFLPPEGWTFVGTGQVPTPG